MLPFALAEQARKWDDEDRQRLGAIQPRPVAFEAKNPAS